MKKELKTYITAPLPFQGQKRRQVKEFSRIIETLKPRIVIDLFGGSGLLVHTAKRAWPQARVIYNDYDNYSERLEHVVDTNKLIGDCRDLLRDFPHENRITGVLRDAVLQRLKEADRRGYVDWITLSSSLHFSMKYALHLETFQKESLFNNVRRNDYVTDGYLDGLEVVRCDYSELCAQYRDVPGALFIADPPYLSTDSRTYSSDGYWHLKDYLNVLPALDGLNFIYFTSDKSQIIDLCEWLDSNGGKVRNIFKGASVKTVYSYATKTVGYTDIMLYKLNLNDN